MEDDLQFVWMPGVRTNREVIDQAAVASDGGALELELERFQGGVNRLLRLVRLLDPQAMPLRGLASGAPEPRALTCCRRTGRCFGPRPLGVVNDGLCWGEARAGAIERFQLRLIACGDDGPACCWWWDRRVS